MAAGGAGAWGARRRGALAVCRAGAGNGGGARPGPGRVRVRAAPGSTLLRALVAGSPALRARLGGGAGGAGAGGGAGAWLVGALARVLGAGGHLETVLPRLARGDPAGGFAYSREALGVGGGGEVALDWLRAGPGTDAGSAPVLILLPGLAGGSSDKYVGHMAAEAAARGHRVVVFNSRGTAGSRLTSPQFYSASFTEDVAAVVRHVRTRHPGVPVYAAGWSLGANILLNYAGRQGADVGLEGCCSFCNPFDLAMCDESFRQGFSRVYDQAMGRNLGKIFRENLEIWRDAGPGPGGKRFDLDRAAACTSVRAFDEAITHVSFGWESVDAYYQGSGSAAHVPGLAVPTLCIQAENDPIARIDATPFEALEQNEQCVVVTTKMGGHLGWFDSVESLRGAPWVHEIALDFFETLEAGRGAADAPGAGGVAKLRDLENEPAAR